MPFDVEQLFSGLNEVELPKLSELFVRMAFATLLGSAIAFRAWRRFMPFMSRPSLQSAQSQTLIAAAGAVMVVVIGDSPARAFGLVGLGSFIRFRSGVSDPRDAAVLFVMIGIGMACGLGLFAMATASTLFVGLLLTVFDYGARNQTKLTLVSIQSEDASMLTARVREVFPQARLVEVAGNAPELGKDSGKLVIELALRADEDAGSIRSSFDRHAVPGIRRIALANED
jgi:uncharacterized membrane protein YhiD involved in acid resistance